MRDISQTSYLIPVLKVIKIDENIEINMLMRRKGIW